MHILNFVSLNKISALIQYFMYMFHIVTKFVYFFFVFIFPLPQEYRLKGRSERPSYSDCSIVEFSWDPRTSWATAMTGFAFIWSTVANVVLFKYGFDQSVLWYACLTNPLFWGLWFRLKNPLMVVPSSIS